MTATEIWVPIRGYTIYQVSNCGRVLNSKRGRFLKIQRDRYGYGVVHLREVGSKMLKVHRLVALHFCQGPHEGLTVNHKDGNKDNNSPDNLEWITAGDNSRHCHRIGLARYAHGRKAWGCKLYPRDISAIRSLARLISRKDIETIYGVSRSQIGRIIRGERWKNEVRP